MRKNASVVAIIGRANVGKSSLFNAILGQREAIVAKEAGTTRDSIMIKASFSGRDFWLVDTAGVKDPDDEFELGIQEQVKEASDSADAILLVVEADVPIVQEDRNLAKMALKAGKPVILVVNKIDKNQRAELNEWRALGIPNILATSTTQNEGINELLQDLAKHLAPATIKDEADVIKVALLGRPNVGKSSLFNTLAAKQQALVSERAGTTRDVNRLKVRYHNQAIELADTAGIRRSGKIERGVEQFSVLRTIAAIEKADVAVLVMDVEELNVQLDQKIAGMVKDAGKGLILAVSKWDKLEDKSERGRIAGQISSHFDFVPWAPLVFTSSKSGQNVTKIFELVAKIAENRQARFKTPELNRWLSYVTSQHPPAGLKGHSPKLNYITQETEELPSFKVFGRDVKFLHWSYKRYLERQFREVWQLDGTPIRFWFIEK